MGLGIDIRYLVLTFFLVLILFDKISKLQEHKLENNSRPPAVTPKPLDGPTRVGDGGDVRLRLEKTD